MKLVNALFVLLFFLCPCFSQVSDDDLKEVVGFYQANNIASFRDKMPRPVIDKAFRTNIHQNLPKYAFVGDPKLVETLQILLRPVLSFYGRAEIYDIVIIDDPIPMIMADSGVVLLITTGMLRRADNDDVLLGYAAHEVGHELFLKYSVCSQHLQSLVENETALTRRLNETLILIELECDAFAAITLDALGYNPLEFIKSIERDNRDYSKFMASLHPPDIQRRYVVEKLAKQVKPRRSKAFLVLKQILNHH